MAARGPVSGLHKTSLEQRLRARAPRTLAPDRQLHIRHRGELQLRRRGADRRHQCSSLCRLRYVGSAHDWQFAIYRASHDDYDESVFFNRSARRSCPDALGHRHAASTSMTPPPGPDPDELTTETT